MKRTSLLVVQTQGRRWADPSILLKVYAHSRMDKRMEAQAKMIEAMGLNEKTAQRFIQ
jgi:hypothetical protein